MTMKEKVDNILGGFFDRNKDYAVELYLRNAVINSSMGKILITSDRIYNADDNKFKLEWNKDENYDVRYNEFSILYDEVMACYEERDEYNQQMVHVILKNGMTIYFECVGTKL